MEYIKKYGVPALCGLAACYIVANHTSEEVASKFGLFYNAPPKQQ